MADNRGGYQRPRNPAPASGPGRLSRRTDGRQPMRQLSDAAYGEQATYMADQRGAPMAAAPSGPQAGAAAPAVDMSRVTPLNAPTQRPNEPVTSGARTGAGPGMSALGVAAPDNSAIRQYMADALPMMEVAASQPFAGPEFRQFVRLLRSMS